MYNNNHSHFTEISIC